jgi:hypothetical protein
VELKAEGGRLSAVFITTAVVGALFTVGGASIGGGRAGLSVATGASVALSNLYVLARIVRAVAVPETTAPTNVAFAWGVIALAKVMVLVGGLWLLMTCHLVDPIPLVVGYGALPIGIAIGAVLSDKTGPRTGT